MYDTSDIVSDTLKAGHIWELAELNWVMWALRAPLPPGAGEAAGLAAPAEPVMVDIGANIGWWVAHQLRAGGRAGRRRRE